MGRINEVRAFHSLPSVSAGTVDEAWVLLMKERGIELWLEGRRLPDLRRWAAEPAIAARVPFQVVRGVATGQTAAADPRRNVVEATPLCLRVSTNEIFSNPNLQNNPPR
ncbi:MAG: RagB/SusD family nutrient uptake outer membrane protein [Longimicrobiaceae bacterium]